MYAGGAVVDGTRRQAMGIESQVSRVKALGDEQPVFRFLSPALGCIEPE